MLVLTVLHAQDMLIDWRTCVKFKSIEWAHVQHVRRPLGTTCIEPFFNRYLFFAWITVLSSQAGLCSEQDLSDFVSRSFFTCALFEDSTLPLLAYVVS